MDSICSGLFAKFSKFVICILQGRPRWSEFVFRAKFSLTLVHLGSPGSFILGLPLNHLNSWAQLKKNIQLVLHITIVIDLIYFSKKFIHYFSISNWTELLISVTLSHVSLWFLKWPIWLTTDLFLYLVLKHTRADCMYMKIIKIFNTFRAFAVYSLLPGLPFWI